MLLSSSADIKALNDILNKPIRQGFLLIQWFVGVNGDIKIKCRKEGGK